MTPEASDGSHIPQTPDTPILGESERKILKLQAYEIIRIRISDGEVLWTRSLEPIFDSLGLPVKTALTTFGADVRYGGYTKMTGSKLGTKSYRKHNLYFDPRLVEAIDFSPYEREIDDSISSHAAVIRGEITGVRDTSLTGRRPKRRSLRDSTTAEQVKGREKAAKLSAELAEGVEIKIVTPEEIARANESDDDKKHRVRLKRYGYSDETIDNILRRRKLTKSAK